MTDLNEKALEAAVEAWRKSPRGTGVPDAIRAYLEAATPPDVAELIQRLDVRWEATDEPTARKINRFIRERKEAATAIRSLKGGRDAN